MEETKKNQKKDVVSLAKERFKAALDAQKNSRLEFEKDLDFKVGQQWDEKLKRLLCLAHLLAYLILK